MKKESRIDNPYVKTLEPVWKHLKCVSVNEEKLQELINKMALEKLEIPAWTEKYVQPPSDCDLEEWVNYVSWVSSVNFCFTDFCERHHNKFTVEYPPGIQRRGSFALGACFIRALDEGIPIYDANFMSRISLEKTKHIFRAVDRQHQIPLIDSRRAIFRRVGKVLLEKYKGRWLNLFESGDWRAFNKGEGIVEQLALDFPSFRDERYYKDFWLKFYKRAQLLLMMYHGRAKNSNGRFPLIEDIKDIGPISDYTVPKVLAFLGVLEYAPEFKKAIKNWEVIYPGDIREVENRLATSYVMVRICDELGINMAQADYKIWSLGAGSAEPHILVPTTDY